MTDFNDEYISKSPDEWFLHGPQKETFALYLDTNGNGTGAIQANGDYSLAGQDFKYVTPLRHVIRITSVSILIRAVGAFAAGKYGFNSTLSIGIRPYIENSVERRYLYQRGRPAIRNNAELAAHVGIKNFKYFQMDELSKDNFIVADFTTKRFGQALRLVGTNQDVFGIQLDDDYSSLVAHNFIIRGYLERDLS